MESSKSLNLCENDCNVAQQIEIKFKDNGIPQGRTLLSHETLDELLVKKEIFKLVYFLIEETMIDSISRHFQSYTKHGASLCFLINLRMLQEMSEESLKCHQTNLHLK